MPVFGNLLSMCLWIEIFRFAQAMCSSRLGLVESGDRLILLLYMHRTLPHHFNSWEPIGVTFKQMFVQLAYLLLFSYFVVVAVFCIRVLVRIFAIHYCVYIPFAHSLTASRSLHVLSTYVDAKFQNVNNCFVLWNCLHFACFFLFSHLLFYILYLYFFLLLLMNV